MRLRTANQNFYCGVLSQAARRHPWRMPCLGIRAVRVDGRAKHHDARRSISCFPDGALHSCRHASHAACLLNQTQSGEENDHPEKMESEGGLLRELLAPAVPCFTLTLHSQDKYRVQFRNIAI